MVDSPLLEGFFSRSWMTYIKDIIVVDSLHCQKPNLQQNLYKTGWTWEGGLSPWSCHHQYHPILVHTHIPSHTYFCPIPGPVLPIPANPTHNLPAPELLQKLLEENYNYTSLVTALACTELQITFSNSYKKHYNAETWVLVMQWVHWIGPWVIFSYVNFWKF